MPTRLPIGYGAHDMKLNVAIVIAALAGCSGGGTGGGGGGGTGGGGEAHGGGGTGGSGGGAADGGGGTGGGGGGNTTPCTLSISGDVTTGTYHQCNVFPASHGSNNRVQVDGLVLTGCNGCGVIAGA
jgi:hypothetical protein